MNSRFSVMCRSLCWMTVGSVENSVVGAWSCSRIARCGLSRSSARIGESGPSESASLFAGEGAGAADAMSWSHSARSFFNLYPACQFQCWRKALEVPTHLASSFSSSSAFAVLATFRGFGFFRNGICGGTLSSRENQSLSVPFVTRS